MITLLMTESNPETHRFGKEMLAQQGIETAVCSRDGVSAYNTLVQMQPDAVLLDVFMQGTDAITLRNRYYKNNPDSKTVFFATGLLQTEKIANELFEAGFSAYFQKPFDWYTLGQKVMLNASIGHSVSQLLVSNYYKLAGLPSPQGQEMLFLAQLADTYINTGYGINEMSLVIASVASSMCKSKHVLEQLLQNHCNKVASILGLEALEWSVWIAGMFNAIDYGDEAVAW